MFEWVEDAVREDLEDSLPKLRMLDIELTEVKSVVQQLLSANKKLEEMASSTQKEMRKFKIVTALGSLCISVITIIIMVEVICVNCNKSNNVIGY